MKKLITIGLLCLSIISFGQDKLDIAIIGTAHHFKQEYLNLQNFSAVHQYILDFQPDIFCIEAIPTDDTLSLQEILPKSVKRADRLKDTLNMYGIFMGKADDSMLAAALNNPPEIPNVNNDNSMLLAGAKYYINYDFFNAFYLWDSAKESEDSLGYYSKYIWNIENTEFRHIVFPAGRQLGIKKFYGIDYRQGESTFLKNIQKVMKKLLFRFKWKPLRLYFKTKKSYKKAEKKGQLVEFINSSDFKDSFSKLIDDLPKKLPRSLEAKAAKEYWLHRNKMMADRLIETAHQQKAQKVVLTVGSAHITHIKRFLETKGHQVHTYTGDNFKSKN